MEIDYKEKYELAIWKLRGMIPSWERLSYNGKTFLQDLVYIFPELKESEDENIRKAIKSVVSYNVGSNKIYGVSKESMLAWLEKQHKPADKVEQKPAWSEEDEINLEKAIWYVKNPAPKVVKDSMLVEWLMFLKDRVQLQSLTITDEELVQAKKDAYNDALDKIEYHSGEPTFDDGWSAAIWYLKKRNTMPQSQWKPSDEQLAALLTAIGDEKKTGSDVAKVLRELYYDLKKLREE